MSGAPAWVFCCGGDSGETGRIGLRLMTYHCEEKA